MNQATSRLIAHLDRQPHPPGKAAKKDELNSFVESFAKWAIRLHTLTEAVMAADKPLSEMSREEAESQIKDAESVLRCEYYDDVRGLADDIKGELKERLVAGEGGETLREWLVERVDECIDSHHRIIYTWQAQKVLLFSENSGAYVENYGNEGIAEHGDIAWNKLAWAAMREDLNEQLDAAGIDVNEPDGDSTCDALDVTQAIINGLSATDKLKEAASLFDADWEDDYKPSHADYSILDFAADVIRENIDADNRAELAALLRC